MKKRTLSIIILTVLLSGCSVKNSAASNSGDSNKIQIVDNHNEQANYQEKVTIAKKKGIQQKNYLADIPKGYEKNEGSGDSSVSAMVYPDKVKSYGEQISRGYKGIVVSGVVTNWHEHARSANNEVLTEYDLLVNKQLTYKSNQNLEGTTIKVLHPGGYTTVGEQMDVMPEKSFAPKPQLTEAERQKVTFVESISEPLPRIGDQIFVALVPNEREANLDFYNKGIFSKTDTFSLAAGANCYFFFNEKTGKYESKVIDPQSGQLKANDLSVGEETTYKNAQRAMLDDVNQNYQETSVSE